MLVNGKNNIIQKNLISTVFWSGSAKPEMAEFNTNNDGAVTTSEAISVIMKVRSIEQFRIIMDSNESMLSRIIWYQVLID